MGVLHASYSTPRQSCGSSSLLTNQPTCRARCLMRACVVQAALEQGLQAWNGSVCGASEWHGVSCTNGHVTRIELENLELTGWDSYPRSPFY